MKVFDARVQYLYSKLSFQCDLGSGGGGSGYNLVVAFWEAWGGCCLCVYRFFFLDFFPPLCVGTFSEMYNKVICLSLRLRCVEFTFQHKSIFCPVPAYM